MILNDVFFSVHRLKNSFPSQLTHILIINDNIQFFPFFRPLLRLTPGRYACNTTLTLTINKGYKISEMFGKSSISLFTLFHYNPLFVAFKIDA